MSQPWGRAFEGRRVLVTGHTGFKGGWLSLWLARLGAEVTGYSLPAPDGPTMFREARVGDVLRHVEGDIRDLDHLAAVWAEARPEVVFHLAAQA
ncbi:MAG: NAD-dependent epimerase/dehydratase family protein, partial [Vicinamibacterales bacterium]